MAFIALLVSFVCFLVASLLGFEVFSGEHWEGWTAAGLLFLVVAQLVGAGLPGIVVRREG